MENLLLRAGTVQATVMQVVLMVNATMKRQPKNGRSWARGEVVGTRNQTYFVQLVTSGLGITYHRSIAMLDYKWGTWSLKPTYYRLRSVQTKRGEV